GTGKGKRMGTDVRADIEHRHARAQQREHRIDFRAREFAVDPQRAPDHAVAPQNHHAAEPGVDFAIGRDSAWLHLHLSGNKPTGAMLHQPGRTHTSSLDASYTPAGRT